MDRCKDCSKREIGSDLFEQMAEFVYMWRLLKQADLLDAGMQKRLFDYMELLLSVQNAADSAGCTVDELIKRMNKGKEAV